MKNTVLLIDTNVAIDYLCQREPHCKTATAVIKLCQKYVVTGYIAFHSLPTIWYTMRKNNLNERREMLLRLTDFLTVVGAPHEKVVEALKDDDFKDFEDCLQEKCAMSVNADYIITENIKDFSSSKIPAITPIDFLINLYNQGDNIA
ncbi:MAG: PIN domain-containing protein [Selenomonadaceae bacterium]|nr:PIN domain-containing protein [Selenomonadaceae bacterium]